MGKRAPVDARNDCLGQHPPELSHGVLDVRERGLEERIVNIVCHR
jgi:hypothetical protein